MNKKKGKFKWTMLHHIMLRRSMGILLVFVMVFSTLPVSSFAVFASENRMEGLCAHHREHTADCGYIPKSEEGEGSPCTYECRICPVEDLLADLPDKVTEDNADDVRARLDEILDLYRELTEDEQGQIDLSRCYELQEALDNANASMTADGRTEQQNTDEASVTVDGVTSYYATLEEAFAAANGKTATITMLTDAECVHSGSAGSPLNINVGNVTLNLNGNTLSGKGYGDYGIIDVSGGSLLVQGEEGKVNVTSIGLSCRGSGKLTVEDITLNLIADTYYANAGVTNQGGTVILNGTKMTGAASDGQIYQYSGTTTINNVTATGATENCPESVCYYNEGTLTINGGTFDKIAVDSGNYGGVQFVAELLGEGYTYKKQGGIWATADDLAAMEISNVTVEKIPLTINPQGDTSWYYSTQQTHMLSMNAAPVDSSDSVAYVWKNGTETLDCSEDACTVPADTPVGSYTYTCEATCDGYTLSHTFTFKIEKSGTDLADGKVKTFNGDTQTTTFNADDTITVKATPTATGDAPQKAAARLRSDYTAPIAGQMALFVGDVQVSEPVQAGEGGTYTMTVSAAEVLLKGNAEPNGNAITLTAKFVGNDNMADGTGTATVNITAVAKAELDGKVIGYYGESNLDKAFANDGATVTLLANVERTNTLIIKVNCTLDLGGHNITFTGTENVWVQGLVTAMTIRGEGEIISEQSHALVVTGSVTLEGGTFTSRAGGCAGVRISSADAQLIVTNEHVVMRNTSSGGYGLAVNSAQSVQLSAGTYSSIAVASPHTLASLLAENCAYYKGSTPIRLSELEGQKTLDGTVIVQECQHKDVTPTSNNDGTHTLSCPYCGYTKTAEDCDYGEYTHNDTSHTRICKLCGYQNVEAHNIKCTAEASGTVIEVSEACKTCGYGKDLGTVTIHIPKLVYGDLTGVVTAENTLTEPVAVAGNVKNPLGETIIFSDHATIGPPTMATLTGNALLSAGEHKIKINIVIIRDENALAGCLLPFTVDPATLTADMVTLSAESTTYSGKEQKPTVTVAGLTEGTDYEVSYTRDGVVTNDFTSAGTVKITVTGKGNYQGEVVKTFTIKKAKPSISVEKAEMTYGEALYESTLTAKAYDGRGKEIAGTFTWKDRFVKPAVSDSGKTKYTVVFTPEDEKNYDSVETEVALTVNKAKNPPKKPGSKMNVSVNCSKVSDIALPEGWKWQDSDMNTALTAGEPITATAEYTGTDKENYEKTTAEVAITRSECSHVPGDFLYTQEGEKEPTCTKEGLGHRECTVCHEVIELEAAVPALGHDYTETVTKEPTTEHDGVKTYTCSRCHDEYTESIPKLTGGGSAGGGGSASGNGTVVIPEVPDTFTETVTKINSAGKTVVVTTTIKYGSNQSILSKTVKSVIEQAAVNTAVTVTVKTDKNGKTTASATVVKTKTAAEKETKNTISAAVVSQIKEAAGTADVMITWKVKDAGGKTKYTIKVNAKDVKNGSVLKIMKVDPKTGEYILVNAKNYPVTKNGNVSVTVDKKGTYILLNEVDAKKYSDAIKKSIKVKEASKSIKAGQKTTIALNGKTNKENIKKITYTSTDKSIASVDKKGRITAKKKGTVTIKAKVTLKNGVTKTVKMKVKVK